MEIILWTILGALAGYIASIATQNNVQQPMLYNILLGIIGALDSGSLLNLIGLKNANTYSLDGILMVILGSVTLIGLAKLIKKIKTE